MSKLAQDIILRPIITEESMLGATEKKYTFKVAKTANKAEIAKAVEELFSNKPGDIKVEKVNTMNCSGKIRRNGRFVGRTASWKKAIVKLTPLSKTIEFFDGMM